MQGIFQNSNLNFKDYNFLSLFYLYGIISRVIAKKNYEIMEVNILAFIATALFILIPTAFLLIIYVKTVSQND
nr:photosystem II protein M [Centrolepis aristata]ULQ64473.1 photosystem II protein M [Centrolepis aristata]